MLNTAVLNGRGARQLWILHMDGATPQHEQQWVNKNDYSRSGTFLCLMSSVVIGADTILRDNPICYPVQQTKGTREFEAIIGAIPSNQAKGADGQCQQSIADRFPTFGRACPFFSGT